MPRLERAALRLGARVGAGILGQGNERQLRAEMTHRVAIRDAIVQRVLERRGRVRLFERLDRKRTALVVIDMQNAFVAAGAPAEVPAARGIVPRINDLAADLRT